MIYGELGIFPITTEINTRVILFWSKLIEGLNENKLSSSIYSIIYSVDENKHIKSQWVENVTMFSWILWNLVLNKS